MQQQSPSKAKPSVKTVVDMFNRSAGAWLGRYWDEAQPDRITPDMSARAIVNLVNKARRQDTVHLVTPTSWGISYDDARWWDAARSEVTNLARILGELGGALDWDGDVPVLRRADDVRDLSPHAAANRQGREVARLTRLVLQVRETCQRLRALADESDSAVSRDAAQAEQHAAEALHCMLTGDYAGGLYWIGLACELELKYGDTPTWGPMRKAIAAMIQEHQGGDDASSARGDGGGVDGDGGGGAGDSVSVKPPQTTGDAKYAADGKTHEQFMVRLPGGKSFRCTAPDPDHRGRQCGCNVFRKDREGRFVCNGCYAVYVGER